MLPVYLAHRLQVQGQLGTGEAISAGDRVLWATGEVRPGNRRVTKIEKLFGKLDSSSELFHSLSQQGVELVCLAPESNLAELDEDWQALAQIEPDTIALQPVRSIDDDVINDLVAPNDAESSSMRTTLMIGGVLAIAVSAIVGLNTDLLAPPGNTSAASDGPEPTESAAPKLSGIRTPDETGEPAMTPGEAQIASAPNQASHAAPEDSERDFSRARLFVTMRSERNDCDPASTVTNTLRADESGRFGVSDWGRVCAIAFDPGQPVASALAVMLEKIELVVLEETDGRWTMPVPREHEWMGRRDYALITPKNALTAAQLEQIDRAMNRLEAGDLLQPGRLEQLFETLELDVRCHRHRLLAN